MLAEVAPSRLPQRLSKGFITADIVGHADEFVAYYRRLIAAATEVGLAADLQHPFPHFAVKPVILTDTVLIELAWYNSVIEAAATLRAIATCKLDATEPQEILDDLERGWRSGPAGADWPRRVELGTLTFPPTSGYSFDGTRLAQQAETALQRLDGIHRELVLALCQDYWNRR